MSPLDQESLFFKIEKIRFGLRTLRKLAKLPYRQYIKNVEHRMTAERLLQVGIEAMLDIGNHIIAAEGLQAPLEYRDIFTILEKNKILPHRLVGRCQQMVGLRNRLVHEYMEIDHTILYDILKRNLGDFEDYVRVIIQFANKKRK